MGQTEENKINDRRVDVNSRNDVKFRESEEEVDKIREEQNKDQRARLELLQISKLENPEKETKLDMDLFEPVDNDIKKQQLQRILDNMNLTDEEIEDDIKYDNIRYLNICKADMTDSFAQTKYILIKKLLSQNKSQPYRLDDLENLSKKNINELLNSDKERTCIDNIFNIKRNIAEELKINSQNYKQHKEDIFEHYLQNEENYHLKVIQYNRKFKEFLDEETEKARKKYENKVMLIMSVITIVALIILFLTNTKINPLILPISYVLVMGIYIYYVLQTVEKKIENIVEGLKEQYNKDNPIPIDEADAITHEIASNVSDRLHELNEDTLKHEDDEEHAKEVAQAEAAKEEEDKAKADEDKTKADAAQNANIVEAFADVSNTINSLQECSKLYGINAQEFRGGTPLSGSDEYTIQQQNKPNVTPSCFRLTNGTVVYNERGSRTKCSIDYTLPVTWTGKELKPIPGTFIVKDCANK